jgi:hypothetical protein
MREKYYSFTVSSGTSPRKRLEDRPGEIAKAAFLFALEALYFGAARFVAGKFLGGGGRSIKSADVYERMD